MLEMKSSRSEEVQSRKLASAVAREVLDLWSQVARVVQYKQDQRSEQRRQELRNQQLDFLVGQTARYTDLITQGMTQPNADDDHGSARVF